MIRNTVFSRLRVSSLKTLIFLRVEASRAVMSWRSHTESAQLTA